MRRSLARTVLSAAAAGTLAAATAALTTTPAHAFSPYCGESRFITEIQVAQWADDQFQIKVYPTSRARYAPDPWEATYDMWSAIQDCVTGLEGELADSIYDQLECHQHGAALADVTTWDPWDYATGDSYDLESWRGTFGVDSWPLTRCGNTLGTDPAGGPYYTVRPDAGNGDLEGAFDNLA